MGLDLVVIGASLGGLAALQDLFASLPADFAPPLAIVQHRGPGDDSRLVELLATRTGLEVREPEDKEPILPRTVYLAPAGYHVLVEPGAFALSVDAPVSHARPSIDVLFESAAQAYGRRLAAVLLSASSEDGVAGIAAVHAAGGLTVVQDPESAASPVAPRAAIARTAVHHVLPVAAIGPLLGKLSSA